MNKFQEDLKIQKYYIAFQEVLNEITMNQTNYRVSYTIGHRKIFNDERKKRKYETVEYYILDPKFLNKSNTKYYDINLVYTCPKSQLYLGKEILKKYKYNKYEQCTIM